MAERDKYFKTRLCAQYQKGRCFFTSCKFAHGSAEQRRLFRRHPRGGIELRERIYRNPSPPSNSPDRQDGKARHTSHGDSSTGKRVDRNAGKRRRLDGHGDRSDRMSDGARDQIKDRNLGSSESKMQVDDQIRDIYSEIMLLENDKQQLQKYLEDKVKEADSLTLEIHELKMQLSKEKEEGKRVTAKIKEYTEAHNYHLRLQDERKRSLAELQNLGEQLDLDVKGSAFTLSDDDEGEPDSSSRRLWSPVEAQETSPQARLSAPDADGLVWSSGVVVYMHASRSLSLQLVANAIDEDVLVGETDERFRARVGPSNGAGGSEDTLNTSRSPFSPPRTVQRQQRERGR